MLVAITRLRLRSIFRLPQFFWQSRAAAKQAQVSPGFVVGRLMVDAHWTFWTITAWDSAESMQAYRVSGAHRKVMPRLADWCDEATVGHWTQENQDLPDWQEVHRRMITEGRSTVLKHPSPSQTAREFPPPRVRSDQSLKPKKA